MESSWNIGSIGMAGPLLRGPSSPRLLAEPPLSPPVSGGSTPTASAQPLEPSTPLTPPPASAPLEPAMPAAPRQDQAQREPAPLESLLIRFRLITSDQLDEALREKLETGKDVGAIVVERGWVNEDQLARLLSYAPALAAPADEVLVPAAEPEIVAVSPETSATVVEPEVPAVAEAEAVAVDEAVTTAEPARDAVEAPADRLEGPVDARPESAPEPDVAADGELPAPATTHEIAPALELVELEPAQPEQTPAEPALEALAPALDRVEELAPPESLPRLEPIAPAAQLVADPEPDREPQALAPPEPTPEAPARPEAAAAPAPVAEAVETTALASAPAEPLAEPVVETAPVAVAPEPQVVRFVEPAPIETIARVFVRLSNGERVEAGTFDDISAAKSRAEEVVRRVSNGGTEWPFFGGRYIRPEAIVSVDVDATVVRYS